MKAFRTNFVNVLFVLTMSAILMVLSFPAWAEDVQSPGAVEEAPAEQAAVAVPDEAAAEAVPETAKKVEDGVDAATEKAAGASAMSMMDSGGGAGAGGAVSSAMIPEPSTFTGSAATRIPIIVPPGRGGIAPNLALVYNSSKRNGWVGVGWDLDMGAIQRSTKHGLNCEGNDYVAISNGASTELVSRTTDWGAGVYGAKIEGAFTRYEKNATDEAGWEATTKDGTRYFYGTALDGSSRQECETGVFKWLLDRVEDTNGNYMTVEYDKDSQTGQIYLKTIEYTGNGAMSPSNTVEFHLEDRDDVISSFISHAEVKTTKRLKTIEVRSYGDDIVRAYDLEYDSGNNSRSLLASVQQYGDDATIASGRVTGGTALPAITLNYQETEDGYNIQQYPLSQAYNNSRVFVSGDFNGDQKTDFLVSVSDEYGRMNNPTGTYVYLSNGNGSFTEVFSPLIGLQASVCQYSTVIAQGDFDNDGLTDFLVTTSDQYGHFTSPNSNTRLCRSTGDGHFSIEPYSLGIDNQSYSAFSQGDYNGDGLTDFIAGHTDQYGRLVNEVRVYWNGYTLVYEYNPTKVYLATGNGSFTETDTYLGAFSSTTIKIQAVGDFNGDGKTDFLETDTDIYGRIANPETKSYVCLSNGDGTFNGQNYPLNVSSNSKAIANGDFNGDGLTDIMFGSADTKGRITSPETNTYLFLCKGDGTFSENPYPLTGFDANYKRVAQGDFNGDGLSDFVLAIVDDYGRLYNCYVFFTFYGKENGTFRYAGTINTMGNNISVQTQGDFNGDGKSDQLWANTDIYGRIANKDLIYLIYAKPVIPDLLSLVSNGRGAETGIVYQPSSKYSDMQHLPFIVQTVSDISIKDGAGNNYFTRLDYAGGKFDYLDRDFRGFAWATKTNPDNTVEKTYFKQEEYNKGRQYQVELKESGAGAVLIRTSFGWIETTIASPDNNCKFVKLSFKSTKYYDASNVYIQEGYTYDNSNGNLLSIVSTGTSQGETITTTREYGNSGGSSGWIWRMTKETLSGSVSGQNIRRTDYEYEINTGNLLKKRFFLSGANDPEIRYEYDTYGNLTKQWDPQNNLMEMIYDQDVQTYPVMIKYPKTAGGTIEHNMEKEYDYRFGAATRGKDENGNWTNYGYDVFGRLTTAGFPDGGQELTEYHDSVVPNYVVKKVKENSTGPTIDRYVYVDGLGRSIMTMAFGESQGIRTLNFFDNMGRVSRTAGPFFHSPTDFAYSTAYPSDSPVVETTYDKRGRPAAVESSDATYEWNTTTFTYNGFSTTVTDPDGCQKTEKKDCLGRLIQVIEYNSGSQYSTYYAYNAAGDLLQVKNHNNTLTTMTYDKLGRKTTMNDPDMGAWTYQYDANSNLVSQIDAKSQTITFAYDALNRVLTKTYSTGDPAATYAYDNLTAGKNGRGRLWWLYNANATTYYDEYDVMGRVRLITKTISGDSARATRYDYDLSGKLTHIGYPGTTGQPNGFQVNYGYYPGSGLLQTVAGSDFVQYASFSGYKPTGKIGIMNFGNATSTIYDYDPKSTRLTGISTTGPGNPIQQRTYAYSPAGDITAINDQLAGIAYTYGYDPLHRLSWEKTNGAFTATDNYDSIGNITSKTMGSDTFTYAYHATKIHAVSQVTKNGTAKSFSYDSNGNMESGWDLSGTPVSRTLTYNMDNMPLSITKSGVTTSFAYDGQASRVKKTVSGQGTTYYIGEHFEVVSGSEVVYIFAGSMRIALKQGAITNYFHKDHLGSSTAMTDFGGNPVESSVYWPYGYMKTHTGSDVSGYKFTDQELDSSTGLYDYSARLYDPMIGRFITSDSIVQNFSDPQTLNRYSYCRNNPLIYVDPSGYLFGIDDAVIIAFAATVVKGAAIGAAIGGTVAAVSGGDIWQGITNGAITGAFMGPANGFIENVIAGGCAGGINAALYGGDIGQGALSGGIFGGIASFGTPNFQPFGESAIGTIGNRFFNSALTGGTFGAVYAGLTGNSIGEGAYNGAFAWTIGEGAAMAIGHGFGFVASGGKLPMYKDGAFFYDADTSGWITFSNVVTGPVSSLGDILRNFHNPSIKDPLNRTYEAHERGHIPQSTLLGPAYMPAHAFSLTIGGISGIFSGYGFVEGSHRFGLLERGDHSVPYPVK